MENEIEIIKPFKQYYQTHPEYVKYHLEYCKTKVECPICKKNIMRCNMTYHKRSAVHKLMEQIDQLKNQNVQNN